MQAQESIQTAVAEEEAELVGGLHAGDAEAFLQAFQAIIRFRGDAHLSTWLQCIIINAALMRLRSRERRAQKSIEEFLPKFAGDGHRLDPRAPWRENPSQLLSHRDVRETVRRQIDRLPDGYRTVLVLRDVEELNTEQTARLLGMTSDTSGPSGNVKVRLHRGKDGLARAVGIGAGAMISPLRDGSRAS